MVSPLIVELIQLVERETHLFVDWESLYACICCVLVESSSNADVDSRCWCISAYPAVASDQLLPSAVACLSCIALAYIFCYSLLFYSCSPYWGLTPWYLWGCCVCLPVFCSGFPGFAAGRGYDPAGGAPGCG
ncbi:ent-kaurene oxidase, chloroplastic [Dorcoceras hygrometricum]|uniref:Ent-kaurene oxidase, chloroplastic n=1 Tax=Dorcoceras hygrometricum TaxID=472368 RepID=A0A2Z7AFG8_9LAMI|nr:ent-kaurene oxidase, chloroplastic [Dorcoceras hygrometricum]